MLPIATPDRCVLLLLRHGATAANLAQPNWLQGKGIDLPLAPEGEMQAQKTADFLERLKLDAVFSSPLLRARQTAEAIAAPHRLNVNLAPALHEVDAGRWEGRNWTDIEAADPAAFELFHREPATGYPGGESLTQVQARVLPAFEKLLRENLGKRIVVVSHNVTNRAFLARLLQLDLNNYRAIPQDNCALNVIVQQGGKCGIKTLNSVWHLGE